MSTNDDMAKAAVLATLQDPMIKAVDFMVSWYYIDGGSFTPVIKAIQNGEIKVKYDASLGKVAYYNHETNEIELGFKSASNIGLKGIIVHECVHAAMDAQPHFFRCVDNLDSEMAGYIAQCLFVIANISAAARRGARISGPDQATDKIFRPAWNIAMDEFYGTTPSDNDLTDLENALKNHPLYRANLFNLSGYDGVHQRSATPQNAGHGHTH